MSIKFYNNRIEFGDKTLTINSNNEFEFDGEIRSISRSTGESGQNGSQSTWDPSKLTGYAAYHATDSTQVSASSNGLQSYMTSKGVTRVANQIGGSIPNTYDNDDNTVYIVSNNSSFANQSSWDPFASGKAKVILMCFAGNVNSSSGYSLDLSGFSRSSSRFYANLNNGTTQTGNASRTLTFNPGNPVVDNMQDTTSFSCTAYFNQGATGAQPVFNTAFLTAPYVEAYDFASSGNGGSLGHGVKDLTTGQGLVSIPIFFDSIGGGYSGSFSTQARTQMYDFIYSAAVWLCS